MADGGSTVLVPKGPRSTNAGDVTGDGSWDRAQMIRDLFAMPLPPPPTRTRTYPTHTVLGRIMRLRGLSVVAVSKIPGGPSARQLGDALAGTRDLNREHVDAICRELGIDRRLL